ncbi:MAG: J domain-containing protein [Lachnospiraceae bacterium]|nr:J domain-containing protein [Lachnospiraceae bacterium]
MVFDPYKVLGVSPDASDDEVKKAYRTLSRRYHPDANVNNPNKAAAEEKFKEVQAAYDEVMKIRSGKASYGPYAGNAGASGQGSSQSTGYGYRDPRSFYEEFFRGPFGGAFREGNAYGSAGIPEPYQPALRFINNQAYREALNYLNRMESGYRNALWYYLRSRANQGLNYYTNAVEDIETAVRLEPNTMQYRSFYQQLKAGGERYRETSATYGRNDVMGGSLCLPLCLLSLCCPCNGPC